MARRQAIEGQKFKLMGWMAPDGIWVPRWCRRRSSTREPSTRSRSHTASSQTLAAMRLTIWFRWKSAAPTFGKISGPRVTTPSHGMRPWKKSWRIICMWRPARAISPSSRRKRKSPRITASNRTLKWKWKWIWFAVVSAIFVVEEAVLFFHFNRSDEDLRVSFQIGLTAPNTVSVDYVFLNLGNNRAWFPTLASMRLYQRTKTPKHLKKIFHSVTI